MNAIRLAIFVTAFGACTAHAGMVHPADAGDSAVGGSRTLATKVCNGELLAHLAPIGAGSFASEPADLDRPVAVHHVPPAPSSLALGLTALAGLGAFQAGRALRRVHLSAVPEWYHAGGPAQIGHSTRLDPDFAAAPLPVVRGPLAADPSLGLFSNPEPIFANRHRPLAAAPRAPPSRC